MCGCFCKYFIFRRSISHHEADKGKKSEKKCNKTRVTLCISIFTKLMCFSDQNLSFFLFSLVRISNEPQDTTDVTYEVYKLLNCPSTDECFLFHMLESDRRYRSKLKLCFLLFFNFIWQVYFKSFHAYAVQSVNFYNTW